MLCLTALQHQLTDTPVFTKDPQWRKRLMESEQFYWQGSNLISETGFRCDIAIIGGGLGGLALASGLCRNGWDAHVFEAASELRTATSTLICLGGNAFTALERLHPASVSLIKEVGVITPARKFTYQINGEKIVENLPTTGELFTIRWAEVQRVLSGLVPSANVHCGYRAAGYTEHADHVLVHFKDKPDITARFVVAADGVRSAIRASMIPNDPGTRYLGHMNWNAVLYNPGQSVAKLHEPGDFRVFMNGRGEGNWTIMAMVVDAGKGYTYWQVRVQSDEPSFTPHPSASGSPHADNEQQPYLVGGGLGKPGSKARVEKMLMDAGFDDIPLKAVQVTPESDIFERAMLDRIPLDELGHGLSSPGGRVVLLGDAAHAMHSWLGQGARLAFEDAHTLFEMLEKHRGHLAIAGWQIQANLQASDSSHCLAPAANTDDVTDGVAALQLNEDKSSKADGEKAGSAETSKLVAEYEHRRLARRCRIQRFAAEGCGLASIRSKYTPPGFTTEEETRRMRELYRWLGRYPELPEGDPDSHYWKPPSRPAVKGKGNEQAAAATA